jgi:hypothetical protein
MSILGRVANFMLLTLEVYFFAYLFGQKNL